MTILRFIIFLLSIFIPGLLIIRILFKEKFPLLFNLALAYALGTFFITMQLFIVIFLFRLKLSLFYFYPFIIIETMILFYIFYKIYGYQGIKNNFNLIKKIYLFFKNLKVFEAVIMILITIQIIFLIINAFSRPIIAYDNLAMWSFKAKTLFYENKIDFNILGKTYLGGGGHINYPWHIPLIEYWLSLNLTEFNEYLIIFIFIIYYLFLLIVIYYFLKNYLSKINSLIFTFFYSSMPLIFYHAYNGYADLTLSFYLLLSFIFLFNWLESNKQYFIFISSLFLGISFFVKIDAIIFIISLFLTLLIIAIKKYKKINEYYKIIINYLLGILVISPFYIFLILNNLSIKNVENGLKYHPEILKYLIPSFFYFGNWNIFWYILIILLILYINKIYKKSSLFYSWVYIILSYIGFVLLYLFTEEYQYVLNGTAIYRNIILFVPIILILIFINLNKFINIIK